MSGSACKAAIPKAPPYAMKGFGAGSSGRTRPSLAIQIGEPAVSVYPRDA